MRSVCVIAAVVLIAACQKPLPDYSNPEGNVSGSTTVCPADGGCVFASGTGVVFACNDVLLCLSLCSPDDADCQATCTGAASMTATMLYDTLAGCVEGACPSTTGGACGPGSADGGCDSCVQASQSSNGACLSPLNACEQDTSGDGTSGCDAVEKCVAACGDSASCAYDCIYNGTGTGQQLFISFDNCLGSACPDFPDGGCGTPAVPSCQTCLNDAANNGGTCAGSANACFSDGSGESSTGCAILMMCLGNCAASDSGCQQTCFNAASSSAQAAYNNAAACIDSDCPETGGGVCATEDSACTSCQNAAAQAGGGCFSVVSACEND